MRKFIISIAAAGAAVAAASPAAAQFYPQPQPQGYNGGYGYNNGYNNGFQGNWGEVRALQARIGRVEWQINRLDRVGSAERLRLEANRIDQRLRYAARGGLNPYEANDIQTRIARLEQRVQFTLANGYGRYGNGYGNGYNGQFVDRDRDGRDDRWERDGDRERD